MDDWLAKKNIYVNPKTFRQLKAMILAAGLGSRLKPLTNTMPKCLVEVNNKPLLQYVIEHLKRHGVTNIVINLHHLSDQIINFIKQNNAFGLNISYSDESAELLNTGGGLVKAKNFFTASKKPFILYASDVITNIDIRNLYATHLKSKALVSLAVKERETSRSLLFDNNYRLTGWRNNSTGVTRMVHPVNKPIALGFSGIHIISPQIFNLITEKNSFNITDLYLRLAATEKIIGYRHDNDYWFEFGRIERLESTAKALLKVQQHSTG